MRGSRGKGPKVTTQVIILLGCHQRRLLFLLLICSTECTWSLALGCWLQETGRLPLAPDGLIIHKRLHRDRGCGFFRGQLEDVCMPHVCSGLWRLHRSGCLFMLACWMAVILTDQPWQRPPPSERAPPWHGRPVDRPRLHHRGNVPHNPCLQTAAAAAAAAAAALRLCCPRHAL